jgi:hypothetical protein
VKKVDRVEKRGFQLTSTHFNFLQQTKWMLNLKILIMRKVMQISFITLAICLSGGCASVQIYSKNDLKEKTGLRFYTPKPYLLVEMKSEKDMTVKTSVIFLPDLSDPQYLRIKPGLGSNELKMAFTNGILNSYGLTTTSDIPAVVNSLAGLISKSADAAKQISALSVPSQPGGGEDNFILYEIVFTTEGTVLKRVKVGE